jgi:DNA-binding NarL/FixJ family response regulator
LDPSALVVAGIRDPGPQCFDSRPFFRELLAAISVEQGATSLVGLWPTGIRQKRKLTIAATRIDLLRLASPVKKSAPFRAGAESCRVVAVGDTIISEQGLVAIIGRDPRYRVCGAAHTFEEANRLVRQHRPDVLLIEPFLENRDAIRWIKDLAMEFPRIRILVVSRQSELTYAERALRAGASGYWMKNSSVEELMRAVETVLAGKIYASQAITTLAMQKFSGDSNLPPGLDVLSNREIAVFALIAAAHGTGQIAQELGISRRTVESHCEHIKAKLGYPDCGALKRRARELFGTAAH